MVPRLPQNVEFSRVKLIHKKCQFGCVSLPELHFFTNSLYLLKIAEAGTKRHVGLDLWINWSQHRIVIHVKCRHRTSLKLSRQTSEVWHEKAHPFG